LDCLVKYVDENSFKDEITCAICRRAFSIPEGGLVNLTANFFIEQVLQLKPEIEPSSNDVEICVMCKVDKNIKYCIECTDYMCEDCSMKHLNLRQSKSHRVVNRDELNKSTVLLQSCILYCKKHPEKQLEFYCKDCQLVICYMWNALEHKTKLYCDLQESSNDIQKHLQKWDESLKYFILSLDKELQVLASNKNDLLTQVQKRETIILDRETKLIEFVKCRSLEEISRLENFKQERLKSLEMRMNEVDEQRAIILTLQSYKEELINKGSACDITPAGSDLLKTVEQMVKLQDGFACARMEQDVARFDSADMLGITEGSIDLIGTVHINFRLS